MPFSDTRLLNVLSHTLWFLPNVASCYAMANLLTQKQNYSMVELSRIMTEATGQEIGYAPVSLQKFADIYRAEGDGDELASMYHAAAMGLMNAVTDDLQHITGHEPMPMDQFLQRNYQR